MTKHGNIHEIAAHRAAERRQNLAQGGASPDLIGTSGTPGIGPNKITAKLSRRQYPGLRFACPGLHSAVRFADSLNHTHPRSIGPAAVLILFLLFTGCTHRGGGISSGSGGWPPAQTTPAAVSSSADVVRVRPEPANLAANSSTEIVINVSISPGFHINANPATFPYLIATQLKPDNRDGLSAGNPIYPFAAKKKFQFSNEPLTVYEGNIQIKVPVRANSAASKGDNGFSMNLIVQACDNEKCYPPVTMDASASINVK